MGLAAVVGFLFIVFVLLIVNRLFFKKDKWVNVQTFKMSQYTQYTQYGIPNYTSQLNINKLVI